jgi:hypothetical protein
MSTSNPFEFNDDDDDRPRRRASRDYDEDDDYDDRPRRSSRARYDDDRDDYDDAPPRRPGNRGDGLGVASMIVGIVGVLVAVVGGFCCCALLGPFGAIPGCVVGVVALILGFVSRSQGSRSGMGVTGIILGFVSVVIALAYLVIFLVLIASNPGMGGPGGGGPGGRPGGNPGFNNNPRFK